jgi:hypothetical protein
MRIDRPVYRVDLKINLTLIKRVIIDQHYRKKHPDLDDKLILRLVSKLNGRQILVEDRKDEFEYFRVESIYLFGNAYRLILALCASDNYLGVVNAFRVKWRKNEKNTKISK